MHGNHRFGNTQVLGVCAILLGTVAFGHWARPENVPVARLVKNLAAYAEEHPKDASAYYALGRVHSMAYVLGYSTLDAYPRGEQIEPSSIPRDEVDPRPGPGLRPLREDAGEPMAESARIEHLAAAVSSFERALAPGNRPSSWGRFYARSACHLSYAYLLEKGAAQAIDSTVMPKPLGKRQKHDEKQIASLVEKLKGEDPLERRSAFWDLRTMGPEGLEVLWAERRELDESRKESLASSLEQHWMDLAKEHYFLAHTLALHPDLNTEHSLAYSVRNTISYEAGVSFLRLTAEQEDLPDDRGRFDKVNENLKRLEKEAKIGGAITPIIFTLDSARPLESLLAADTTVSFDLDGTGRDQRWPWLQPDTAILCWDPENTGKITSGRQLFGSVTWWILFPDGYRALDALDDNRDGELSGDELAGLAVWQDTNSNGVSDPGEVRPISDVGIQALSVHPDTTAGGGPACHAGLRMTDGRTLPTYDWVVSQARNRKG